MLDRLTADAHLIRISIEACLHSLKDGFVLPPDWNGQFEALGLNRTKIVLLVISPHADPDQAHAIMVDKYHANYVLSCPYSSTTTIFMSEAPKGFYGQLQQGQVPNWLQPVPLPSDSPYKMWKIVG